MRLRWKLFGVLVVAASLAGCATTALAPNCKGHYVRVNSADKYQSVTHQTEQP